MRFWQEMRTFSFRPPRKFESGLTCSAILFVSSRSLISSSITGPRYKQKSYFFGERGSFKYPYLRDGSTDFAHFWSWSVFWSPWSHLEIWSQSEVVFKSFRVYTYIDIFRKPFFHALVVSKQWNRSFQTIWKWHIS